MYQFILSNDEQDPLDVDLLESRMQVSKSILSSRAHWEIFSQIALL